MKEFTMCGRPGKCCPVAKVYDDGKIIITDDYGGKVTITKEQLLSLVEQVGIKVCACKGE